MRPIIPTNIEIYTDKDLQEHYKTLMQSFKGPYIHREEYLPYNKQNVANLGLVKADYALPLLYAIHDFKFVK